MDAPDFPIHGAKLGREKGDSRIGNVYKRLQTGRVGKCDNFVVDWRVPRRMSG